jgi:beta-carotene hydroxylase
MNDRNPLDCFRVPAVAWPTILLFCGCIGVWTGAFVGVLSGRCPPSLGLILSTVSAYALFTPVHESAHRSAARARWVNETMGRIGSVLLMVPFSTFRYVHLEHHKHTNEQGRDPDLWSGGGPRWALPLRWLTQDVHYFAFYLRRLRGRPAAERWETASMLVVVTALLAASWAAGHGQDAVMLWVLPVRLAVGFLSFGLDFLPHAPYLATASSDPYKATSIWPGPMMTSLLLYQNYHLIHHLYPAVPFYRYASIWRYREPVFRSRGVIPRGSGGTTSGDRAPEAPAR